MTKKGILIFLLMCSLLLIPVDFSVSLHDDNKIVSNFIAEAIVPSETWNFTTGGAIHTSPAFIDINGDRNMEIIFGSIDNKTYCIDSSGSEVWNYTTGGNV
ncbi:MAG: hypothetical protein FK733_14165, partial [Asgard group archaeon]|nr:hypothetical protein [Asgard group archaeon]